MRKQELTGTLEEQCETLYQIALEKMEQGNYTGAYHALKDINKHKPDFRDVKRLFAEAKAKKSEQRFLLLISLLGATLFVWIGSRMQIANDLVFIAVAVLGGIIGYIVALWISNLRHRTQL